MASQPFEVPSGAELPSTTEVEQPRLAEQPFKVPSGAEPSMTETEQLRMTEQPPFEMPPAAEPLTEAEGPAHLAGPGRANEQPPFEVPPGAELLTEAECPAHPTSPDRAITLVAELKSNAALFAAFSFGALNLPGTLVISESRITSAASSVSTSRPVPDSDLLKAFVFLDATTLSCMLVCVVVSQLLLYRLSDGSYERVRYSGAAKPDPRDSALGRLVTQ